MKGEELQPDQYQKQLKELMNKVNPKPKEEERAKLKALYLENREKKTVGPSETK